MSRVGERFFAGAQNDDLADDLYPRHSERSEESLSVVHASSRLADSPSCRLETEELSVHFGQRSALEGITARFGPAETVSLLGPNGAGKSTLLKVLAGMLPPTHGVVRYNGAPVRKPNPAVAYVPRRICTACSMPACTAWCWAAWPFAIPSRWRAGSTITVPNGW